VAQPVSDSIVSFASPPVVEVVAGVAFDGLTAEAGALLAAFWKEELRQRFPSLQQQPPYTPPDEQFPADGRAARFNLITELPPTRLWAQSGDGQELLQLQPGWFACNWRKLQPNSEYDRWRQRRAAFQHYFTSLVTYLEREGAGQPKVRQCEVTYINHISVSTVWSKHAEFSKIFTISLNSSLPYPVEQISFQTQFALEDDGGPYGRLHVKILPAFGPDGKSPLYVLELTARGAPKGDGVDGTLAFLDLGRRAVDLTFLDITSEAMHREWGLQP
jgi:uncharacterized protein (TIGR04255 family)